MRVYRRSVLRMRFGETDAAGIVFYPSYFGWFDAGMHELLRSGDEPGHGPNGKPKHPLPIVEIGESSVRVYVAVVDGRVIKAPIPAELRAHLSAAGEEG
jgi:hypothetical protein